MKLPLKNSLLLASLVLAGFTLSGCGSESSGANQGSQPVTSAKDSDGDGVADTEDARPFDAQVSAQSVTEYFDDDGNLIGTGTFEIRKDGKITAEETVPAAGSDQSSFRAEIEYTQSGQVASVTIDDGLDGGIDFTVTNTYDAADRLIRKVSTGVDKFELPNNPLNTQAPIARVYNNPLIAGIRVLRRAGTVELAYNAAGSITSQQTDYGSDNRIEISESAIYDSVDRLIQFFYAEDDVLISRNSVVEGAYLFEGDDKLPASELLVAGSAVQRTDAILDGAGRVTFRAVSSARAGADEVSAEQLQSDAAGSTALSQQMLKNSYAAEYAGLSGASTYFDLLYRSTYLSGLPDSGSLVLKSTDEVSTRYDRFGNTTDILKRPGLNYWVVSTNDPQGQLISLGADINLDGQIDLFDVQNSYNTQGFLTRSEFDPEFIDGELIPQQVKKISYGAFGPIYGSLSVEGNSQSAASFVISYDTYGLITDYRLRLGDLINFNPYASISHRYVGSSDIDPTQLNRLILGLSDQPRFDLLLNLQAPLEPVIVNPDLPEVPVDECFGGLSFC